MQLTTVEAASSGTILGLSRGFQLRALVSYSPRDRHCLNSYDAASTLGPCAVCLMVVRWQYVLAGLTCFQDGFVHGSYVLYSAFDHGCSKSNCKLPASLCLPSVPHIQPPAVVHPGTNRWPRLRASSWLPGRFENCSSAATAKRCKHKESVLLMDQSRPQWPPVTDDAHIFLSLIFVHLLVPVF